MDHPFKALREAKGLSQYDLAFLAGKSQGCIGQAEAGLHITTSKTIAKIAGALRVESMKLEADIRRWESHRRKALMDKSA